MLTSRAFWMARRRRKLPSTSPPPSLAAMVISRLARVNAWPRLASTTAFLCLMPAHFECPDIYPLFSCSNMLSAILLDSDTHPAALANLKNVTWKEGVVPGHNLSVSPYTALFDQTPCLAVGRRQPSLHHSLDDTDREPCFEHHSRNVLRLLISTEPAVEVLLGRRGRLRAVQALDEPPGQRRFCVPGAQREDTFDLSG